MRAGEFLSGLDEGKVIAAIREAEHGSSGEVRVFVAHGACRDAIAEARRQFDRMGMRRTRRRNAVLVFVAPKSRSFAIIGDEGIHARVGQEGWDRMASAMADRLRGGDATAAVLGAIGAVGEELARHFPPEPGDTNELPDAIAH